MRKRLSASLLIGIIFLLLAFSASTYGAQGEARRALNGFLARLGYAHDVEAGRTLRASCSHQLARMVQHPDAMFMLAPDSRHSRAPGIIVALFGGREGEDTPEGAGHSDRPRQTWLRYLELERDPPKNRFPVLITATEHHIHDGTLVTDVLTLQLLNTATMQQRWLKQHTAVDHEQHHAWRTATGEIASRLPSQPMSERGAVVQTPVRREAFRSVISRRGRYARWRQILPATPLDGAAGVRTNVSR
jgi:hypothetical protein